MPKQWDNVFHYSVSVKIFMQCSSVRKLLRFDKIFFFFLEKSVGGRDNYIGIHIFISCLYILCCGTLPLLVHWYHLNTTSLCDNHTPTISPGTQCAKVSGGAVGPFLLPLPTHTALCLSSPLTLVTTGLPLGQVRGRASHLHGDVNCKR